MAHDPAIPPPMTGRESLAERLVRSLAARDGGGPGASEPGGKGIKDSLLPVVEPPPIALDFGRLQGLGFMAPFGRATPLTENFRVIKRQILADSVARNHSLMITSALPGEGKTFVAMNLALSMTAEQDLHVVLVDCAGRGPGLAALFGLGEPPGLVELLAEGNLDPAPYLRRTSVANLSFLPAGRPHPHRAEMMAGKRMRQVLDELAARFYDRAMIIVDTPSVLVSAESINLSMHVGRVVVVVENGRIPRDALERTLSLVQGCPNVDCILNMVEDDVYGLVGYG